MAGKVLKGAKNAASPSSGASVDRVSPTLAARIPDKNLVHFMAKYTGERTWSNPVTAIVNPTTFSEKVSPQYSARPVLGLSHEVLQYIRTGTRSIDMELWISYHILMIRSGDETTHPSILLDWRNFFEALTVPASAGLAPPLVTFDWPGAQLSFKGVVSDLSIDYQRFAVDGTPIEFKITLTFLEVADSLMTAKKVRWNGFGMNAYGGKSPFGND